MIRGWGRLRAYVVPALLLCLAMPALSAPRPVAVARTIRVKLSTTGEEVMFDQLKLTLPFARKIRLRYKNDAPLGSKITHNVAIIRPERVAAVMKVLQDHDYDLSSVRGSADILAVSRVLDPGQEDVVDFAPPAPGDYVYICLMPGHGDMLGMRGVLTITR